MYAKHLVTKILLLLYFLDIILIFLRGSEALSSQICLLSLNGKWKDESLYPIWMVVFLFGFLKPWLLCWSCMKILKGICCVLSTLSPFEVFVVIVICLYDFNVLQAMQRCSQPIPCSTFNNDGSIFAYAVCFICCFHKPYLFTYAV